jgi:hypothetical protein
MVFPIEPVAHVLAVAVERLSGSKEGVPGLQQHQAGVAVDVDAVGRRP